MAGSERTNGVSSPKAGELPPEEIIFGHSPAMASIRQKVQKILRADVPLLLQGESGAGKELLAQFIHSRSAFSAGRFVKVNCAAIPGALLESELFGYERGAFTGAHVSKPGRVELAKHGTLFLDEIADLDSGLQSKLLQFLQDRRFSPIGGNAEKIIETRLICATNRDLQLEVDAGTFRADLYYRINVVRMTLPPLRERREDITLIAEYFHRQFQERFAKPAEPLSKAMLQYFENLNWPGNIRELSNSIARHVLVGPDPNITPESVTSQMTGVLASKAPAGNLSLRQIAKAAVRDRERSFILQVLQANQWNRRETARALKISYRTLIYKIREAGLPSRHPQDVRASRAETADG
jgi:two-component system response regulator AtoC